MDHCLSVIVLLSHNDIALCDTKNITLKGYWGNHVDYIKKTHFKLYEIRI